MTDSQKRLLDDAVETDLIYQELLCSCLDLEPKYNRIINTLSQEDRAALEHYIALCEEMDYRRICLAFMLKSRT